MENQDQVEVQVPVQKEKSRSQEIVFFILCLFGVLALIGAIGTAIASRWKDFSFLTKFISCLAGCLVFQGAGLAMKAMDKWHKVSICLALAGTFFFCLGTAVLGQNYSFNAGYEKLCLVWAIAALPFAWLWPSKPHHVLFVCAYAWWATSLDFSHQFGFLVTGFLCPIAILYLLFGVWGKNTFYLCLGVFAFILTIIMAFFHGSMPAACIFVLLFWSVAALVKTRNCKAGENIMLVFGVPLLLVLTFMFSQQTYHFNHVDLAGLPKLALFLQSATRHAILILAPATLIWLWVSKTELVYKFYYTIAIIAAASLFFGGFVERIFYMPGQGHLYLKDQTKMNCYFAIWFLTALSGLMTFGLRKRLFWLCFYVVFLACQGIAFYFSHAEHEMKIALFAISGLALIVTAAIYNYFGKVCQE